MSSFNLTLRDPAFDFLMPDTQNLVFEYIGDEIIADFKGSGSESLLQILQVPDLSDDDASDIISTVFTEMLILFEDEKLDTKTIADFLALALTDEMKAAIFCQVLDVFPQTEKLQQLLVFLYEKQKIIKPSTLAQFLDSELLISLQIVPSGPLYRQLNTRKRDEFYTQKKFNLYHEEFEGYSKLINEMYSILKNPDCAFQVNLAVQVVELMIGHYQLDPNRVLDILLDIFSNFIVGHHKFIVQFFKASKWWPSTPADALSGFETLNIGGCEAATNCLALKLAKYPSDRELPETFKAMISIFIKEGFISFGQLYNCFQRKPDEMSILEKQYQKELEDKVFRASASALALAAPLADEEEEEGDKTKSSINSDDKSKNDVSKQTCESLIKHNFEFQMLKSFLGNGLYWPAVYILSQYPFVVHVDPEVPELMHRLLSVMLQPIYAKVNSLAGLDLIAFQQEKPLAFPRPLNKVHYEDPPQSSLYCFRPTAKAFSNKKLVYFYTEWKEGLPSVSSSEDLIKISHQFIKFYGVQLATDIGNFSKLCEVIVADLENDSSDPNKEKWFFYFKNYIFPAIGSIQENHIPADKAFEVMKFFKEEERFNMYGELHQVLAKNNPHVKIMYGKAEKATKDLLKRLSKENVDQMMRRLAKVSYSNPLPCFLTILQQIESYDNLNNLVVETARYFNNYGWDNLTLAILMRLSASGRTSFQADGLNERQWIQSLASFVGKLCLKYPEKINLHTILQFLLKSFHNNEGSGLLVLKEMLSYMGGIQAITNLTVLQLNLIGCGSSLQKIVYSTIGDERFERQLSGKILCETLFSRDVVNEFLVLLCKLNAALISGSELSHLKVLANKNDDIDAVLHLFCTLIDVFGNEEQSKNLLNVSVLVEDYGVPIPWAFEVWRKYLLPEDIEELKTGLQDTNHTSLKTCLSTDMFVTFWKLKLYDLNYSTALYESETEKLTSKIISLKEWINFARRDRETTKESLLKSTSELRQTEKYISEIPREQAAHEEHNKMMIDSLVSLSRLWFADANIDSIKATTTHLLQECILPRAVHSSFDALYSAEFLFKLHDIGTQNYSIILALDGLFRTKLLFGTLFTCTPTEAENLGIFYSVILTRLNSWTNESVFNEQLLNGTLFITDMGSQLTLNEFRQAVFDYHSDLLEDISLALTVQEYMSRRNAIIYLKNLLGIYPSVEDHCEAIIELIENISKDENRDDLKLSSSALIGHVKSRSGSWVHMWDFIDMPVDAKAKQVEKREEIKKMREKVRQQELKLKQEAEKKAYDEEQKRIRERQEKLAKEREMERSAQAQAASTSISYDDSKPRTERSHARVDESARGRYDRYSSSASEQSSLRPNGSTSGGSKPIKGEEKNSSLKDAKNLGASKDSTKESLKNPPREPLSTAREPARNSAPKAPLKDNNGTKPAQKTSGYPTRTTVSVPSQNPQKPIDRSRTQSEKYVRAPVPPPTQSLGEDLFRLKLGPKGTSRLKDKINEGKQKYRENKALSDVAKSRTSSPASNTSSRPLTPAAVPPPPTPPVPTKRAPLPPQQAPPRPGFGRDGYGGRPSGPHRPNTQQAGPLPPPSVPPPRNDGKDGRYRNDNKRRYEGSGHYDKRQRY